MTNLHQHLTKWWKTECISSKIRNETKVSTLNQKLLEFLPRKTRWKKEIKGIQVGKGRSQIIPICRSYELINETLLKTSSKNLDLINAQQSSRMQNVSTQKSATASKNLSAWE
jgi:hypothetical protein